jgi:hypothetical protein
MSVSSIKNSPVVGGPTASTTSAPAPAPSSTASSSFAGFTDGFEQLKRSLFGPPPPPAAPPPSLSSVLVPPEKLSAPVKVEVPFFSQYEPGHGFTPGDTSCFKACTAMAKGAGATVGDLSQSIEVATSDDPRSGKVTVDPAKAKEGTGYIDQELKAGRPVVVGVSHPLSGDDATVADKVKRNTDHVTDHFVVITGRGTDAQGNTYYSFNDPASKSGADTNTNNRLYLGADGKLSKPAVKPDSTKTVNMPYEVSMVRRNDESL